MSQSVVERPNGVALVTTVVAGVVVGVVVAAAGTLLVELVVPGAGADGALADGGSFVAAGNGGSPEGPVPGDEADGKTLNVVPPKSCPDCVNACTKYVPSS